MERERTKTRKVVKNVSLCNILRIIITFAVVVRIISVREKINFPSAWYKIENENRKVIIY